MNSEPAELGLHVRGDDLAIRRGLKGLVATDHYQKPEGEVGATEDLEAVVAAAEVHSGVL